jgi:ribosome-binding protein aMBF1 (putative translation factor)
MSRPLSPLGESAAAARTRRAGNRAYADEAARLRLSEALARLLVGYRLRHELSQPQLAARLGTSHSVVSRLESGQAPVMLTTLRRITGSLGARLLLAVELPGDEGEAGREFTEI